MRIVRRPDKCVARLERCEAKRIPVNAARGYLAGYYFGCPHCGKTTAVSTSEAAFRETGNDVGDTPKLTMTSATCGRCSRSFSIVDDEVILGP